MAAKTAVIFKTEAEAFAFASGIAHVNDSAIHAIEQRGCVVEWTDEDDHDPDRTLTAHEAGFGR
jgi:hypothetical protein